VVWLHGDHLGSTSLTTDGSGNVGARQAYYPFGATRWVTGTLPTDFGFTGQRNQSTIRLYDYHARFYDPYLNRFISADTIVPDPANPQDLNRYSYVRNSPLVYVDPTGHYMVFELDAGELHLGTANDGTPLVATGSDVFKNEIEVALANFMLSGNERYLDQVSYIEDYGYGLRPAIDAVAHTLFGGGAYYDAIDLMRGNPLLAYGTGQMIAKTFKSGVGSIARLVKYGFGKAWSAFALHTANTGSVDGAAEGFGLGRKLDLDEKVVIFESTPGSGKFKTFEEGGISAQSLDVTGAPEKALEEAFQGRRGPRPNEPYWETTGGQIAATGRFGYLDAAGSRGHVSIWGGRFQDAAEFVKIWSQKFFGP